MKRLTDEILARAHLSKVISYLQIGTVVEDQDIAGYMSNNYAMTGAVEAGLKNIRTHLDKFSTREVNSLFVHGVRVCYDVLKADLSKQVYLVDLSFLGNEFIKSTNEITKSSQRQFRLFAPDWGSLLLIFYCLATAVAFLWITAFTAFTHQQAFILNSELERKDAKIEALNQSRDENVIQKLKATNANLSLNLDSLAREMQVQDLSELTKESCAPAVRKFELPDTFAKDGSGNVVGKLSSLQVLIVVTCGPDSSRTSKYIFAYSFYDGSGTWQGNQDITLSFLNEAGASLEKVTFPLDRGHCVYSTPEVRTASGTIQTNVSHIESVSVSISPVVGKQGSC
jgi:hypothetical protein